jgi:hypothetical protein
MTIFSPLPGSRGPRSWLPVRCQGALLSRPTLRRPTPIATTALQFSVLLDAESAMEVQIADYLRLRGTQVRGG